MTIPSTTALSAQTPDGKPVVSIICPVYNEEGCIPIFFRRLVAAIEGLRERYEFELIFTNNGSTDRSLEIIRGIREREPWVQVVSLSRNFDYQASLMSGLRNAAGDAIVIIDVDCEDPPELIPRFIEGWEKGCDIVYGERVRRPESRVIQMARKAFYRITRRVADSDFILDMAEFSLFERSVRDTIISNRSTYPFIRSEIGYAGFRRLAIPYTRQQRVGGETHYNFARMTQFAIGGFLSSSTFPLRLVAYTGLPVLLGNGAALLYWFVRGGVDLQPVFLVNLSLLVMAAVVLSIYLARTYKDGVQRPLFILDRKNTHLNRPPVDHGGAMGE